MRHVCRPRIASKRGECDRFVSCPRGVCVYSSAPLRLGVRPYVDKRLSLPRTITRQWTRMPEGVSLVRTASGLGGAATVDGGIRLASPRAITSTMGTCASVNGCLRVE
jgi:hypothetical protein